MTPHPPTDPSSTVEPLGDPSIQCAVLDNGRVALVRVVGRGTFLNSAALGHFAQHFQERPTSKHKFIVDLSECPTMDSTFMGTLATITLTQMQNESGKLIVCNANEHNRRLLKTLGLSHVMDLRLKVCEEFKVENLDLHPAEAPTVSRLDRILQMIEAHEKLVDLDSENEVRFSNVLKYLRQSLEEEQQNQAEDKSKEEEV